MAIEIVDFPIKTGIFYGYVKLPEGIFLGFVLGMDNSKPKGKHVFLVPSSIHTVLWIFKECDEKNNRRSLDDL